jgi:hypothetical protein
MCMIHLHTTFHIPKSNDLQVSTSDWKLNTDFTQPLHYFVLYNIWPYWELQFFKDPHYITWYQHCSVPPCKFIQVIWWYCWQQVLKSRKVEVPLGVWCAYHIYELVNWLWNCWIQTHEHIYQWMNGQRNGWMNRQTQWYPAPTFPYKMRNTDKRQWQAH